MNDCEICEPYVAHLVAEHRRLDEMLVRTQHMFPDWGEVDLSHWVPRVLQQLRMIREELRQHFAEEEAGGCLEEAVSRCPAVSAATNTVIAEHPELLAELDRLIEHAASVTKPTLQVAQQLEQEFRDFVHHMRAHEAMENKVLQRGFAVGLDYYGTAVR